LQRNDEKFALYRWIIDGRKARDMADEVRWQKRVRTRTPRGVRHFGVASRWGASIHFSARECDEADDNQNCDEQAADRRRGSVYPCRFGAAGC